MFALCIVTVTVTNFGMLAVSLIYQLQLPQLHTSEPIDMSTKTSSENIVAQKVCKLDFLIFN